MINDNDVILYIKELLGEENISFLNEDCPKEKSVLIYTSVYNMVGISIRNNVRDKFKEMDEYFTNTYGDNWYHEFEDWLHPLIIKAVYE